MKKLIAVLLLLISITSLNAADLAIPAEIETLMPSDETIDYFFDESYVKVSLMLPDLSMDISHITNDEYGQNITYYPNSNLHLGVEFNFYHIGVAFSKEIKSSDDEEFEHIYGKTEYSDIMLSYYRKNFGVELSYQKYSGFYLSEPEQYGYNEGDPETKRPDLELMNIGGRFYYNIADLNTYSIAAVIKQSERQKDFIAIALLAMFSVDQSWFNSDYSLIPPGEEAEFGEYAGLSDGKFTSIGISPGVGISLSLFNFYAASSMFIGGGYQFLEYKVAAGTQMDETGFLKLHFNLSGGYNGDTILAGFNLMLDTTTSEMKEKTGIDQKTGDDLNSGISVDFDSMRLEIFSGIRF